MSNEESYWQDVEDLRAEINQAVALMRRARAAPAPSALREATETVAADLYHYGTTATGMDPHHSRGFRARCPAGFRAGQFRPIGDANHEFLP